MKSRILFGAAMMVALFTGLVGTAGIASAHTVHAADGVHVHRW